MWFKTVLISRKNLEIRTAFLFCDKWNIIFLEGNVNKKIYISINRKYYNFYLE